MERSGQAMKIRALAIDYDGTLAWHGVVEPSTCEALARFRESGRKLIMVTGREMKELFSIFRSVALFDLIVGENGGLLYWPGRQETTVLGPPPPDALVQRLRERGVRSMSVGRTVIGTQEIYSGVISEALDELGLDWHAIPNKGALMVLPRNVNKASGLLTGLSGLRIDPAQTAGVGDAENDFAFLDLCGYSAAVANSIASLKPRVDHVTAGSRGAGVEELIDRIADGTLAQPPVLPLKSSLAADRYASAQFRPS
jgi:hydroxymethylpyrimidine pyrophosphatase-like HAD family hydrolase